VISFCASPKITTPDGGAGLPTPKKRLALSTAPEFDVLHQVLVFVVDGEDLTKFLLSSSHTRHRRNFRSISETS
jgi:uncharacterized protein YbbK (DUF523 family)